ncbi:nuclease [Bacillus sp. AFS076308]|uniref:nuclease-related domain-containing protein n=1 Tax=unclassified Bacillus (in: firmicutes) TaxID=185979 RepID=UPI000BF85A86|nr:MULTISPECIES: nuclease-related domain-containing protein [unclassified Bacillus (in: firmicutes)]PFO07179.1 nuclease [Bacillus sp. AFS076308]PGV55523.1 nuclease [Bacillus sp. AFS037270]
MILKDRPEPLELRILKLLDARTELEEKEKKYLHNKAKGYEGEKMFDLLTGKLNPPSYLLHDLLLESNNSKFQIDTLMIRQDPIYLFEVKNYEGDFNYENGRFYSLAIKKEIKNPLLQLERCESLLRQLLQSLGYHLTIEAYVIFINPKFHLYQSPMNKPIIYPNQLPDFMCKLNRKSSTLNGRHKSLAEQLVSMHQTESPYEKYSKYSIDMLKKGIICAVCHSFDVSSFDKHVQCQVCGHCEGLDSAVLRAVGEIKLLYPNEKITTNLVFEWCESIDSKKTIRRVLKQNLICNGKTKGLFYE